jgi:fatty-acyl-CoA synthase
MDEDGNVVYRGRYKAIIKSGGENISEREVEVLLEELPSIKSVQVIGVPDKEWGQAVTAVIEVKEGVSLGKDDVIEFCRNKMARFKIPKNVLFIERNNWPLLGAGKVDKVSLKKWAVSKLKRN